MALPSNPAGTVDLSREGGDVDVGCLHEVFTEIIIFHQRIEFGAVIVYIIMKTSDL